MGVAIGLGRRRACLLRRRHRGFAAAGHCTRSRPIFRPQPCLTTACNRDDCNGARRRTAGVDSWRAEADRNEFGGIQCDRINIREPRLLEPKQPESKLPQPNMTLSEMVGSAATAASRTDPANCRIRCRRTRRLPRSHASNRLHDQIRSQRAAEDPARPMQARTRGVLTATDALVSPNTNLVT